MTRIFDKEYHKEQARICLKQARLEREIWRPREWIRINKPHRLEAAKRKAIDFWMIRADAHIKIALKQEPVFLNFAIITPDSITEGPIYAE